MYIKLITTSVVSLGLLLGGSQAFAKADWADDASKPKGYVAKTADGTKPNPLFYGDPPAAGRWGAGGGVRLLRDPLQEASPPERVPRQLRVVVVA